MCWFGYIEDRHVAKEDMKVFKILYREPDSWKNLEKDYVRTYKSPFYGNTYKLGEEKKVNGLSIFPPAKLYDWSEYEEHKKHKIEEGLHCYSFDQCDITYYSLFIRISNYMRGILQRYPKEDQGMKVKVVLCIIPKGTVYWENKYGEIVTEKLIPKEEI